MVDWVEVTSAQHDLVKHWVRLRTQRAYRYEQGRVLVMGRNLVRELGELEVAVGSEPSVLDALPAKKKVLVPEHLLTKITGTQSSDGWIAEVSMPSATDVWTESRVLVLDRIQNPGNLGTLLRTALAMGWTGAYLIDGCVDPYNDKALRAAKGATFRMKLQTGPVEALERVRRTLYVADLHGEACEQMEPEGELALVLGHEAGGVSDALTARGHAVTISMAGEMESLNVAVAGAILMYQFRGREG